MSDTQVYEERYRFSPGYARMLFICVAFVLGGLFAKLPLALRVAELLVFGTGGVVLLVRGLRLARRTALRVDESGLTLDGSSTNGDPSTQTVPWSELRAVRLSRQREIPNLTVITAVRRGQAQINGQVRGWSLNAGRLSQALAAFAPGVRFTDER